MINSFDLGNTSIDDDGRNDEAGHVVYGIKIIEKNADQQANRIDELLNCFSTMKGFLGLYPKEPGHVLVVFDSLTNAKSVFSILKEKGWQTGEVEALFME